MVRVGGPEAVDCGGLGSGARGRAARVPLRVATKDGDDGQRIRRAQGRAPQPRRRARDVLCGQADGPEGGGEAAIRKRVQRRRGNDQRDRRGRVRVAKSGVAAAVGARRVPCCPVGVARRRERDRQPGTAHPVRPETRNGQQHNLGIPRSRVNCFYKSYSLVL